MKYQTKFWLLAALAFGSAALAGVLMGATIPARGGVENPAVVLPILFVVIGLVMGATWLWWRKTDDLQQHGQLLSWWWGGTIGALAMIVFLVVTTGRHSEMSLGATYLFFAEFAGFAIVWCVWKLRGRGSAE